MGKLLWRGLLVGILAGMLAVGFGKVFGEPSVERAIAFEAAGEQAKGEVPEPEMVSRATQSGLGFLTAGVTYGAGLGGIFALAFALVHGRVGSQNARVTAGLLALAAFVVVAVVPMLKYPANPPSIGDAETIGLRTALFFGLIVLSVVAAIVATLFGRLMDARYGGWTAALAGAGLFVVLIGIAYTVLPTVDEVPAAFPATVLWDFRMASLGMQAVTWATLGLVFGWLADRCLSSTRVTRGRVAFS